MTPPANTPKQNNDPNNDPNNEDDTAPRDTPRDRSDPALDPGRSLFLILLACTGNVSLAAQSAGLSRQLVSHWRDTDRLFAAGWDAATEQFADQLRYAAFKRGVEGRVEPVFYQGKQIGERVQYSDPLLLYLLQLVDDDKSGPTSEEDESERDQLLAQIAAQVAALGPQPEPAPRSDNESNRGSDRGSDTRSDRGPADHRSA